MEIKILDGSNFDEHISAAADKPVIIDFFADWCIPCKRMAPALKELAEENEGKIIFYKVNVDDDPGVAARYSVQSIPYFVSFKNGSVHKTMIGAQSKQNILSLAE